MDSQSVGSTPRTAHACNCVGCCRECGTCRTWHGHTREYCKLIQRQIDERIQLADEAERRSQIAYATAKNDTMEAYWAALEAIEA